MFSLESLRRRLRCRVRPSLKLRQCDGVLYGRLADFDLQPGCESGGFLHPAPFCPNMDRGSGLRGGPVVIAENSADSPATTHGTASSFSSRTVDQFVRKGLVVSFTMVVGDELSQSPTKVPFAQRDDTMEALLLHRPDKPFACALQFGAPGGVRSTRTPAVESHCSTALLHFGSRSQTRILPLCRRASDSLLTDRRLWMTNASSGYGVEPRTCCGYRKHSTCCGD